MACCLMMLGASLAVLQAVQTRRGAIALTVAATACGTFGATSLAGHALGIEFMLSGIRRAAAAAGCAGLALLGAGLCSAVLHHVRRAAGVLDEARSIVLTAVWMLSAIAVVAGISTFALAQYEYQDAVRADLARTLRERRAFLEYAIQEHVQQVTLAAHPTFAASLGERKGRAAATRSTQLRLQDAADVLRDSGFSGWRFNVGDTAVVAGQFIDAPDISIALSGKTRTHLLLKNRDYYLRTEVPISDGDTVLGTAVAEEPFPALTKLKLEADSRGDTGEMALCAAVGARRWTACRCAPIPRSRAIRATSPTPVADEPRARPRNAAWRRRSTTVSIACSPRTARSASPGSAW